MSKIIKNSIQQGDVILKRLTSIPSGEKTIISRKKLVLAEGETTGHFHGIEEDESELIRVGEQIILNLTKNSTLTHQEHNPIPIEAGIWEVGIVQEYDYFAKMVRPVVD